MGKGGHLEAPGHGVGHHTGKWQRGGLTRTAAAHRSRWVSWDRGVVEEFGGGDGKWGVLGEVRRAAVEIREDQSNQGRGALKIAQGPDGSRGFRSQRTRQVTGATGLEKEEPIERSSSDSDMLFWGCVSLALTLSLGALLVWLWPSVVAGGLLLYLLGKFFRLMRMEKSAFVVAMVAVSLVAVCWVIDWGVVMLPVIDQELRKLHPDAVRLAFISGTTVYWREARKSRYFFVPSQKS